MPEKMTRRVFVSATAVGAVSVAAWGVSRFSGNGTPNTEPASQAVDTSGLKRLIAPHGTGATIAGATLVGLTIDPKRTAVIDLKRPDGQQFRVEVCRLNGDEGAIATTQHYALYLRNGGDGSKDTEELEGLALMALGEAIRANEASTPQLDLISKKELWSGA